MTDRICGSTETSSGKPCQNPAGMGTEREIGPCNRHLEVQGRPSTFNDEAAREAIEAARWGTSISGCARAAGVPESTLRSWLDRSLEFVTESGDVEDFSRAFRRARAKGEQVLIRGALLRGETEDGQEIDGQHARFLLSTSFKYQKSERHEHLVDSDADLREEGFIIEYERE